MIESFFWYNQRNKVYHYTKIIKEVDDNLFEVIELIIYGDAIYENHTTYPINAIERQKKKKIENLGFIKATIGNLFGDGSFKYILLNDTDEAKGVYSETIYER